MTQKQDIPTIQKPDVPTSSTSTESPSPAEPAPQSLPFPPHAVRSSSPKLDPSELYLKSKALLDSKREFSIHLCLSDVVHMKLIFRCDFSCQHERPGRVYQEEPGDWIWLQGAGWRRAGTAGESLRALKPHMIFFIIHYYSPFMFITGFCKYKNI